MGYMLNAGLHLGGALYSSGNKRIADRSRERGDKWWLAEDWLKTDDLNVH